MTCAENLVLNKEANGWGCAALWCVHCGLGGRLGFVENGRGLRDPSCRQSAQQQCPASLRRRGGGAVNGKREDRKVSRRNQASLKESVS